MSQKCKFGCGRETNNPDGICTICRMDGVATVINDPLLNTGNQSIGLNKPVKGESKMAKEYKKCSREGCEERNFMKGFCYRHFIEEYGKDALPESMKPKSLKEKKQKPQVSPKSQKATKSEHRGKEGGKLPEPEEKSRGRNPATNNNKTACLAQLLYASDLLDNQLNSALEAGEIDTKVILDIRNRLGIVLRGSVPAVEATA